MNNEKEMTEYKNGADIPTQHTEEFATDFIVETPSYSDTQDFEQSPTEYVTTPEAEQSATVDDVNEEYGAHHGCCNSHFAHRQNAENSFAKHDTETSEELTTYSEPTTDNVEKIGYDVTESNGPNDETAATIDEWYTTDKPSARERCMLDDYEIISDVLGSEKQLVKLYSTALCEASEEPFRNILRENLDNAAENQYKAFEFMQKRGMYPTEQASEQNIAQAKQQFGSLTECDCGCKSDPCGCGNDGCGFDK